MSDQPVRPNTADRDVARHLGRQAQEVAEERAEREALRAEAVRLMAERDAARAEAMEAAEERADARAATTRAVRKGLDALNILSPAGDSGEGLVEAARRVAAERDAALAKAQAFHDDWYKAKHEFGVATGKARAAEAAAVRRPRWRYPDRGSCTRVCKAAREVARETVEGATLSEADSALLAALEAYDLGATVDEEGGR